MFVYKYVAWYYKSTYVWMKISLFLDVNETYDGICLWFDGTKWWKSLPNRRWHYHCMSLSLLWPSEAIWYQRLCIVRDRILKSKFVITGDSHSCHNRMPVLSLLVGCHKDGTNADNKAFLGFGVIAFSLFYISLIYYQVNQCWSITSEE